MKNLKFKAWLKKLQKFDTPISIDIRSSSVLFAGVTGWQPFDELELLQYVFRKDAAGHEIYEGDVYRHSELDEQTDIDIDTYFICAFVESVCGFCWIDAHEYFLGAHEYEVWPEEFGEAPYTLDVNDCKKIKTIGNINQKPIRDMVEKSIEI